MKLVAIFVLLACVAVVSATGHNKRKKQRNRVRLTRQQVRAQSKSVGDFLRKMMQNDWEDLQDLNKKKGCEPTADKCCKEYRTIVIADIKAEGVKLGWAARNTEGRHFEFALQMDLRRQGGSFNDPCEIPSDCRTTLHKEMETKSGSCSKKQAESGTCVIPFEIFTTKNTPATNLITYTDFDGFPNTIDHMKHLQLEVELREEDPCLDDEMGYTVVKNTELRALCKQSKGKQRVTIPLHTVSVGNVLKNAGKAVAAVASSIIAKTAGAVGGAIAGAAESEDGCKKVVKTVEDITYTPEYAKTEVRADGKISLTINCCGFDDV